MDRKGSFALGVVAMVLAMILIGVFLIDLASRECNSNRDCPSSNYCNANNECVPYPNNTLSSKSNFLPASFVIGLSLIVASLIYKKKN